MADRPNELEQWTSDADAYRALLGDLAAPRPPKHQFRLHTVWNPPSKLCLFEGPLSVGRPIENKKIVC